MAQKYTKNSDGVDSSDCSNQQVWEFNFFVFIQLQDLSDMLHYITEAQLEELCYQIMKMIN